VHAQIHGQLHTRLADKSQPLKRQEITVRTNQANLDGIIAGVWRIFDGNKSKLYYSYSAAT